MLTTEKIYHAAKMLRGIVRKTELLHAPTLCEGVDLYLKAENLQTTGSFKLRGAYYKMLTLSDVERARGVIAASAGNHAQGVALAANRMGISSVICLPDTAPLSKTEATRRYGADVRLISGAYDEAYKAARMIADEGGRTFIHPFDDEDVIAGQGTVGAEIIEQNPTLDAIVVPVGGGGLISGVAYAAKSLLPGIKIYGVQASGASAMHDSIRCGSIVESQSVYSIADGIAVKKPGRLTFSLAISLVDDIVTVDDEEIKGAVKSLISRCKLVTEGAGAVSVAAIMSGRLNLVGKRVCCILSGGNIDSALLSDFLR